MDLIAEPKKTVSRSIYRNLLTAMLTFGCLVGVVFPPFASIVLKSPAAMSVKFFLMCICAGLLVGLVNFTIFRIVVSRELSLLAGGMKEVLNRVDTAEMQGEECSDTCNLAVTSADAIGDIQESFNEMTAAIAGRLKMEAYSKTLFSDLSSTVELDSVARLILNSFMDLSRGTFGLLYGNLGTEFKLLAHRGVDVSDKHPLNLFTEMGPINDALSSGEVIRLDTEKAGLKWVSLTTPFGKLHPKWLLLIPLRAEQKSVGLAIISGEESQISTDRQDSLGIIRSNAAPYLQNAILHQKITELAAIDDLTMILNRRFGLKRLDEGFSQSVRHGVPLSVFLLDIDHFKKINDTYGHDAGDAVLRMVAAEIEEHLRSGDTVCRYGGEEFLVISPGSGLNDGAILVERLRRTLESSEVKWGNKSLSITISGGLATWPVSQVSSGEELVSLADEALYYAKAHGRNQIAMRKGDTIIPASELQAALKKSKK